MPGDRLENEKLVGFINRNYLHDERGNWYFQNGPQRVYVNLEAAPFIARTDTSLILGHYRRNSFIGEFTEV